MLTTRIFTPEELQALFATIQAEIRPALAESMRVAVLNVESQAKTNCTPGKSPYEKYWFPSKFAKFPDSYTGAPYSDDRDPNRELPHMREAMYSEVQVVGESIVGIVGNTKKQAFWVHEGTSKMQARPFITDAIEEKMGETQAILSEGIDKVIRRHSE